MQSKIYLQNRNWVSDEHQLPSIIMAAAQIRNESLKGDKKQNKRRRKKRRTEDFSSDSSSSSSSDSENESGPKVETAQVEQISLVNIDDIDIESDQEKESTGLSPEKLSISTQRHLQAFPITHTLLADNASIVRPKNVAHGEEVRDQLQSAKSKLDAEFLALMASEFSSDLDELRKKPDFTDKLLVILAKTLQSGSSLFDKEALKAVLQE